MAVHQVVDDARVGFGKLGIEFGRGGAVFHLTGKEHRIAFGRKEHVFDASFDMGGLSRILSGGGHGPELPLLEVGDASRRGEADGLCALGAVGELSLLPGEVASGDARSALIGRYVVLGDVVQHGRAVGTDSRQAYALQFPEFFRGHYFI